MVGFFHMLTNANIYFTKSKFDENSSYDIVFLVLFLK